jgi:DNA (cytosine-5)-methyltransferase 1
MPDSCDAGALNPTQRLTCPLREPGSLSSYTATPGPRKGPAVRVQRGHNLRLDRHPGAPDPGDLRAARAWVRSAESPTAVDLFCGAGGLSLGLQESGFTVLVGADSDALAMETHTANVGGLGYTGDLTDPTDFIEHLQGWGVETADLLVGGVPCQPFSRAGQSKIKDLVRAGVRTREDPRAALWQSFMRVVEYLEPRAVLVENVPSLPSWDDGAVLIGFLESFRALGYSVHAQVIDCFLFGVPQHRARLFIVATKESGPFSWPEPTGEFTSLRDAIGDLPVVPAGQRSEELRYRPRRALSAFQETMRSLVPSEQQDVIHDHITRAVRDDDLEAYELLAEGQTYADLPERLRRYRSDIFTDKYKRLAWNELSRTITAHLAKDGYWYIHPQQHRTLSVREAARIQTFPDHVRFAGQPSHRYRQIGNAVPPIMGLELGRALIASLNAPPAESVGPQAHEARDDLLEWHRGRSRQFPWRGADLDPWHVLMAEMCLHRTRADQVAPVFEALLRIAPTPQAMVDHADEALAAMQSLGLRWRAENVVKVAAGLLELFDGQVPDNDLELRMLPGVGDYVAQAVLCFGFARRAVLIDTNTVRIVSRLNGRDATRRWQLRLDLHRMAGARGPDAEFNYALLDLGALVCRAGTPRCGECPLRSHCVLGSGAEAPSQLTLGEPE